MSPGHNVWLEMLKMLFGWSWIRTVYNNQNGERRPIKIAHNLCVVTTLGSWTTQSIFITFLIHKYKIQILSYCKNYENIVIWYFGHIARPFGNALANPLVPVGAQTLLWLVDSTVYRFFFLPGKSIKNKLLFTMTA